VLKALAAAAREELSEGDLERYAQAGGDLRRAGKKVQARQKATKRGRTKKGGR